MSKISKIWLYSILMLVTSGSLSGAYAYVGPGPGMTVIGALWAVIAAILLALLAVIRWPLRYLLRKLRNKKMPQPVKDGTENPSETD